MPNYMYRCPKCESIKDDIYHSYKESPEILCDKCKEPMKIKIGATGFIMRKDSTRGLKSSTQDLLRYQAGVISETQGGL